MYLLRHQLLVSYPSISFLIARRCGYLVSQDVKKREDRLRLLQANSNGFLHTLPLQGLIHDYLPLGSPFPKP